VKNWVLCVVWLLNNMSDEKAIIAKLLASHGQYINLICQQLADYACLFNSCVSDTCSMCNDALVTVEHARVKIRACDMCAARCIVAAKKAHDVGGEPIPGDIEIEMLMDENAWADVQDAARIRKHSTYLNMIRELEILPSMVH